MVKSLMVDDVDTNFCAYLKVHLQYNQYYWGVQIHCAHQPTLSFHLIYISTSPYSIHWPCYGWVILWLGSYMIWEVAWLCFKCMALYKLSSIFERRSQNDSQHLSQGSSSPEPLVTCNQRTKLWDGENVDGGKCDQRNVLEVTCSGSECLWRGSNCGDWWPSSHPQSTSLTHRRGWLSANQLTPCIARLFVRDQCERRELSLAGT